MLRIRFLRAVLLSSCNYYGSRVKRFVSQDNSGTGSIRPPTNLFKCACKY